MTALKEHIQKQRLSEYTVFGILLFVRLLPVAFIFFSNYDYTHHIFAQWADPHFYYNGAAEMLSGSVNPYNFFPPLQFVFIMFFLNLGGGTSIVPMAALAVVGWLTVVIIYKIAEILFGHRAAIIAALISGLYPNFIFYGITFFAETLTIFWMISSFFMLVLYCKHRKNSSLLCAGILWGLASQTRGGLHFFIVCIAVVIIAYNYNRGWIYTCRSLAVLLIACSVTIYLVGVAAYPLHNNRALNSKSGIASAALGVNRLIVPCTDYGDVTGNLFYEINHINVEQWPAESGLDPLHIITLPTRQVCKTLAAFVMEDPVIFLRHSLKKLSCLWAPHQDIISFIKRFYYKNTVVVDAICFVVGTIYVFIVVGGLFGIATKAEPLRLIFILLILFYCVLIFLTVGNSRLRLPMMPLFILYCAAFFDTIISKKSFWKNSVHYKLIIIIGFVFILNSIYKFKEITLSPAEIYVRKIECSISLGFLQTASYLLQQERYNRYCSPQQNQRIHTAKNTILKTMGELR